MPASPDETIERARRYATIRYRLLLVDVIGGMAFLWAYQALGGSDATAQWAAARFQSEPLRLFGFLAVFGLASYLVFLPLHFYSGFLLEHRFGLSRLRLGGWAVREAKQALLGGALGLLLMEGWYALLRHAPQAWTVLATVGWVFVSVVIARVFPTWLLPMFYKTEPLADAGLTTRLLALCERAGVPALGVFRVALGVETRKANAALAGVGRTRRVLLSDTLLEQFTPEEIETILAHELAHQRYRHITKGLALAAAGSWVAFSLIGLAAAVWVPALGLQGLADPAGVPVLLLALSLVGLIGMPVQNGISRRFEWQADRFAVELTRQPLSFAAALRRLAQLNLADPAPPHWIEWLFYDHPAISRRIQAAEAAAV